MDSAFDHATIFSPVDGSNSYDTQNVRIPSFGVEMEFCVATLKPGEEDTHPSNDRTTTGMFSGLDPNKFGYLSRSKASVQTHIADSLNEEFKNLNVQSLKKGVQEQQFWASGGTNQTKGSHDSDGRERSPVGEWIVKSDLTVVRPRGGAEAYSWFPIEINSPALLFSDAAVNHVQQVVDYLTGAYRVNVNHSCGLHLHVGCQNAGFTLPHLKKICAIFWTFEPCFYYLIDEARWKNNQCQLITRESRLDQCLNGFERQAMLREGLKIILATRSVGELVHLLTQVGYRFGFNLQNLRKHVLYGQPEKTKRTIEMRFHEGTMDSKAIYH